MLVDTAVDGEDMGAMVGAAALPEVLAETTGDMEEATTPTGVEDMAGTAREAVGAGMAAARASAAPTAVRPEGAEELPEGEDEVKTGKSPTKMFWERGSGEAGKCTDEPHSGKEVTSSCAGIFKGI